MSIKTQIESVLSWNWTDSVVDNSKLSYANSLADGQGIAQANRNWHSENRVLVNGTSDVFNLTAMTRKVLEDTITVDFEWIKAIHIVNENAAAGDLVMGNADYDCWWEPFRAASHQVDIPANSTLLLTNRQQGWIVSSEGSSSSSSGESNGNRMLRIAAEVADVTYSIAIIGIARPVAGSSSSSGA